MAAVTAGGARTNLGMTVRRQAKSIRDLSPADLGFDPLDCIREVDNAYSQEGGLVILYGNLAPKGAVIKAAGVRPEMLKHSGPAVIFEAETEAYEGIVNGKVKAGDVVVIRYEGPRGGPGMQEMLAPTTAIKGMRLDDKVALVTDGRFSGGTAGACIGHVSPEAAAGGPIAPASARRHHRHRHSRPHAQRSAERGGVGRPGEAVEAPPARYTTGCLAKYAAMATSADTGAVLKWD